MANGDRTKRPNRVSSSSSSDGKLRDSDLIGWLVGFLFFAIIIGGLFQALQSSLGRIGGDGFGIGAIVSADGEIDVWEFPGAGDILGTQDDGEEGEIIDGPEFTDDTEWWFVDFEESPDGWVDRELLNLEEPALGIGDLIVMIRTAGVWDRVGGGTSGGLQHRGSLGELIDGPELFNGERWWDVDFRNDPDGWVRESDITRAPGLIARLWQQLLDYILLPSLIISVLLLATVVVLSMRVRRILASLKEKYQTPSTSAFVQSSEEREQKNERWERVQSFVNSTEPANWRLAILEADVILTDIVARMGYSGETLGEQLKHVEKSDFVTLDKAWEAHKVRNNIAHEGGDFILTQREARRVVGLYEEVFKEFQFI